MKKYKLVILCLFILVGGSVVKAHASISATERAALIALYNSTNGDSWTNNSGWKEGELHSDGFAELGSESSWFGILLSADGTSVQEIDLDSNNLAGTIPDEIGDFSNLENLSLGFNQLSGSIPDSIGNIGTLVRLYLTSNDLSGIPETLQNLSNLERLSMSLNQFSGTIPVFLTNISSLKILSLSDNSFTGGIPGELGSMPNMTSLYLGGNQLTGSIPTELMGLTQMDLLNLKNNQLSGVIPDEIGNLTNLRVLYLDANQLTGGIPDGLRTCSNLRTLSLGENQLTGSIPSWIGELTAFERLNFRGNQLTGSIPDEIGNLLNLELLNIRYNQLVGPVPDTLLNLTSLTDNYSDFRDNYLLTDNDTLRDFLNTKQLYGDWESTQGATTNVPDIADMTQASAESAITAEELTVGDISTTCDDTIAVGNVISSSPTAGSFMTLGSVVNLVISSGPCPDSAQENIESIQAYDSQDTITIESPDGTTLSNCLAIDNPSPGDTPAGIDFPYGLFSFTIDGVTPGGSTVMTITLPAGATPTTYYKYGSTVDNPSDHWYEFMYDGETGAEISGNIITLHFVDGKRGDSDLDDTNGTIVDPGGPGIDTSNTAAETPGSNDGGGSGCFINSLTQQYRAVLKLNFNY